MKKFLTTFAGIAAAFASDAATMSQSTTNNVSVQDAQNMAAPQATVLGESIATTNAKGDQFNGLALVTLFACLTRITQFALLQPKIVVS